MESHEKAGTFEIACRHGYTVFAMRTGGVSKFSGLEMTNHVQEGIKWVKQHSEKCDINAAKIGMMGASTGGYLACLSALTADKESSVQAVAVFYPITDFLDYGGQPVDVTRTDKISTAVRKLLFPEGIDGLGSELIAERMKQQPPLHLVHDHSPPFLFIHSSADFTVPLAQSKRMHDSLVEQGVDSKLIVTDGFGHPWPDISKDIERAFDWFDEKLVDQNF